MRLKILCSQTSHIQKCLDLRRGVFLQYPLSTDHLQTMEEQAIHSVFQQHPELYNTLNMTKIIPECYFLKPEIKFTRLYDTILLAFWASYT